MVDDASLKLTWPNGLQAMEIEQVLWPAGVGEGPEPDDSCPRLDLIAARRISGK